VDTAVVVNVLCSVPDPQSVCNGVYRVLKKGGVAIIFEHVASTDLISRVVQGMSDCSSEANYPSSNPSMSTVGRQPPTLLPTFLFAEY